MDPIKFIEDDPVIVQTNAINDYQSISGRTLHNADPEMLMINSFAYRLALNRKDVNWTGNQNLLPNATGAALEQLGTKSGTYRLDPSAAVVPIEFQIAGGAPTLTIPAGTRVKSQDGAVMFATDEVTNVTSGTSSVIIDCTCTVVGYIGNGYGVGYINSIVDPQPYVTSAANTEVSGGGADEESDPQLRTRIPLASSTYSVAGPTDAYKYYAKSASSSVVDVAIICGPVAGGVQAAAVNAGGSGWVANDQFTITGGTTLALCQVLTVSGGAVATFKILKKGAGYSTGTAVATVATTGVGTSLTVDISAIVTLMTISIYPLLEAGALPNQAMLDLVEDACSDKKVRPLSDTVVAKAPTKVDYSLTVNLTLKKNAPAGTQQLVYNNLIGFVNQWDKALGVDLILNQFKGQCMMPGVYTVAIPSFPTDVAIAANEFGNCTAVVVNVANVVDEP